MFKVDRKIKELIGPCERLSEDFHNQSWTVQVKSEQQGNLLLNMKELLSEPVIVTAHDYYNQSQGVLTCALLKGYSDQDITEGLSEHGVIQCRRIIRNPKSTTPEPTATLILTFNTPNPPDRITIRTGLKERIRPYIPLPRRCFNCQHYGHSGAKCRRPVPVCFRCGANVEGDHKPKKCQLPINCVHCKEPPSVTSKTCPKYIFEKELLTLRTKEHLTFAEARAKMNMNMPTGRSFASVTKNSISSNQSKPKDENNNNSSQTSNNQTYRNKGSQKRPLERRDSSPPEPTESQDSNATSTNRKPIKQPRHDNNCNLIIPDQEEPEEMQVSEPPDKISNKKRNSAPDLRKTFYKDKDRENEILNTVFGVAIWWSRT